MQACMHADTHTLTWALSFLRLYYWCWARFVPTQPSVLDSPTLCPFCSMPTTTLAGWHKQSDVVLSKCERLINIPRYLRIGDRQNIPKRNVEGGLICPFSWMTSKARIDLWCEIQSCHDYLSCKQNWHQGVLWRAVDNFLQHVFQRVVKSQPACFWLQVWFYCTWISKAKLPEESGERSHKTSLGPSWDRGHVTRVFENTFLIHGWGF